MRIERKALCHPNKKYIAKGLCNTCYRKTFYKPRIRKIKEERIYKGAWWSKQDIEDYELLLLKQHGVCAICGLPPKKNRRFHRDHNHITLSKRGLLCHKCNVGLGHFNDNKALLEKAIKYLEVNTMAE